MSSKMDGARARTATDLELKYNFGQSFAEVYGLVEDAQKAAERAENAVDTLDKTLTPEEIFNRLTNYGEVQGIYREDDNIYINASYIKSGQIAAEFIDADNLEVDAANIKGTLSAEHIDTENLSVQAANIEGLLTADKIKLGGKMTVYQDIDSTVSAGSIGYTTVSIDGVTNRALGIEGDGHVCVTTLNGNMVLYSLGNAYVASLAGVMYLSGKDLYWNGSSLINRITVLEAALSILTGGSS